MVSGFSSGGNNAYVAGDVTPLNGNMTFGSDNLNFRFDLYATSAEPGRTNMIRNLNKVTFGTGKCLLYAPRTTEDAINATYDQTSGSPYLYRTSAQHNVAVGTTVTGTGIPSGTFVRRNLANGWIELSQPVTETVSGNAVEFAAFAPDVYQHINTLSDNGGSGSAINFATVKYGAADKATLEIDTLSTGGNKVGRFFLIDCTDNANYYSWHIILHKVVNVNHKDDVKFRRRTDIEFAARADGGTPGFPEHAVYLQDSSTSVDFTVGEGLRAEFLALSNLVGKVTKRGEGTLATPLGANADASTGSITVEEGVFEITGTLSGATPVLEKVTISAGATLKLSGNTQIRKLTAEPGAIIDGPGSLEVPGADLSSFPAGVFFTGGASFIVRSPGGAVLKSRPVGVTRNELPVPAFWVNTDDPEHDMEYFVDGSTTNVVRWNDCRAKENPQGDWCYAITNYLPAKLTGVADSLIGGSCVEMARADSYSDGKTHHSLVWNRTITGIRSVFVVWNCSLNNHQGFHGGILLGWFNKNKSDEYGDFARREAALFDISNGTAAYNAIANVRNGEIFHNGLPIAANYTVNSSTDSTSNRQLASLFESHPVGTGAKANAFAYSGTSAYRSGGQRLYECLVFTNELTYAERMKVREYLSAKWFKTGANAEYTLARNKLAEVDASEIGAMTVAEGVVDVARLRAETETFVKKGAGELVIEDCVTPNATVSVEAGTLYLKSEELSLAGLPYPDDVHLHVDATATNTITFKTIADKGECVKEWASVRGASAVSATAKTGNAPLHKIVSAENAGKLKPGMPVVDMGEFYHETTPSVYGAKVKDGTAEYMIFGQSGDKTDNVRTVFMVMGSTHGGGQPLGWDWGGQDYNHGGWIRDTSWALDSYNTKLYQSGCLPFCFGRPTTHSSIRLNGEPVTSPTTTGFSGDYDLLTATTFAKGIKTDAFACSHYQNNLGGLELGEAILSTRWHSPAETKHVEAYLLKKWFNREVEGNREPRIGTLKVAAGATVETLGGGAITVGAVEGAGTVNAKLAFAGDAANLKVAVADGAIAPLAFGATTEFTGGTVTVDGDAAELEGDEYVLVNAAGIAPGQAWALNVVNPNGRRKYRLAVESGRLVLRVGRGGFVFFVR